ncbi:hypothetical protein ABZ791_02035 [Streptomyces huasconensis]|uniref:Uncharacterized protein n=1 Tax=Streptomyces huasconensis TaxID=1854574 RepID=A0ABV3LT01_9ACTN
MTADARRTLSIAAPFALALAALTAPAHAAADPRHDGPHCQAIDSFAPNKNEEHTVALSDGHAYAGAWDKKAKNIRWQELSDNKGYPAGACDITLSEQGNSVWVKAITTDGKVYETSCVSPGNKLICNKPWTRLH